MALFISCGKLHWPGSPTRKTHSCWIIHPELGVRLNSEINSTNKFSKKPLESKIWICQSCQYSWKSCFFSAPREPIKRVQGLQTSCCPTPGKSHQFKQFNSIRNISVYHKGVSKNRGIPKSSILIGFSIINHPFWGTTILGNTHKAAGQHDPFFLGSTPHHHCQRLHLYLVAGSSHLRPEDRCQRNKKQREFHPWWFSIRLSRSNHRQAYIWHLEAKQLHNQPIWSKSFEFFGKSMDINNSWVCSTATFKQIQGATVLFPERGTFWKSKHPLLWYSASSQVQHFRRLPQTKPRTTPKSTSMGPSEVSHSSMTCVKATGSKGSRLIG